MRSTVLLRLEIKLSDSVLEEAPTTETTGFPDPVFDRVLWLTVLSDEVPASLTQAPVELEISLLNTLFEEALLM